MAKSVRISDDLFSMASLEAKLMHRSIAQQIEHWASIGQALEASGEFDAIRSATLANMRARETDSVRRGRTKSRELTFIPEDMAKKMKMVFPKDAFAEYDRKR